MYNVDDLNKNSESGLKLDSEEGTVIERGNDARGPRIIAVASGKGGVGKTNISINLGIAFHKMGKKVIVMDADLGLANVNVILGIVPKYNLYSVLKGHKKLKDIIMDTPYGIKMIAGASGFYQLASLDEDKKKEFVDSLLELRSVDIIIIDTGAGISDNVVSFLLAADDMIIVTTPEPTSITDAYGIIKTVASLGGGKDTMKLIMNRVDKEAQAKRISDRVTNITQKFLGVKIENLGFIFEDDIVFKSVKKQKPFMFLAPKSKASICVEKIAGRLEDIKEEDPKGLKKFIKALFGGD